MNDDAIQAKLPSISYFLTREEWLAVFGAWLVSFEKKVWEVNGSPAPSMEVDGVGQCLRHGIRVLAHAGYSFRALEVSLDGPEILSKGAEPIELGNVHFLRKLANGSIPNPLHAMSFTRDLVRGLDLSLDLDPLVELCAEIQRDLAEFDAEVTEEERAMFGQFLQEAMRTIGVSVPTPVPGSDKRYHEVN